MSASSAIIQTAHTTGSQVSNRMDVNADEA